MKYIEYTDLVSELKRFGFKSKRPSYMARAMGFDPDKVARVRLQETKIINKTKGFRPRYLEDRMVREMVLESFDIGTKLLFALAVSSSAEEAVSFMENGFDRPASTLFRTIVGVGSNKFGIHNAEKLFEAFPETLATSRVLELLPFVKPRGHFKKFLETEAKLGEIYEAFKECTLEADEEKQEEIMRCFRNYYSSLKVMLVSLRMKDEEPAELHRMKKELLCYEKHFIKKEAVDGDV